MSKYLLLLQRILRKNKLQFICFTVIILISSLFMNLGLTVALNFDKTFENKWTNAKMPDTFFIVPKDAYTSEKESQVNSLSLLKYNETRDCVFFYGSFTAGNGKDVMMPLVIYNRDDGHKYNFYNVYQKDNNTNDNAAYVSYWFYSDKGCRLGDTFKYKVGNKTYNFIISGFVEDMQYGNNNCSGVAIHLSDSAYKKFASSVDSQYVAKSINLKTDSKLHSEDIFQKATQIITKNLPSSVSMSSGYYQQSIKFRTMMTDIIAVMIVAFALAITVLSLFICGFRIRNSISEDMQVIGILKSMGYKSKQVRLLTALPYIVVCLIASVIGIFLSFTLFPVFSSLVQKLTGLIYYQNIDFLCIIATIVVLLATVLITVLLSTRKVKKYPPVVALDMGIEHHNFKKCYFQLEKSHFGLNATMGAKSFIGSLKQNISLFFIMALLAFVVMYAQSAYLNLNVNTKNFINSISEEYSNVIVSTNGEARRLSTLLEGEKGIRKTLCMDYLNVTLDEKKISCFICNDFSKQDNPLNYKGRNPSHDNEVALGSDYDSKYKVGDTVSLTFGDTTKDYLVVGFIQAPNYMGKVVTFTDDGFTRISKGYKPSNLFVYTNKGYSADDCITDVKENYKDIVVNTINNDKTLNTSMGTYLSMSAVLVIIIISVVAIIATLVLFIIFSTIIIQRKKDFGILKAMGFTTPMLTFETILGILPSIVAGVIAGCTLGYFFMNNVWILMFKSLAVRKCNLGIPLFATIIIAAILILYSVLISLILCGGLKKISANKLVSE